MAGFTNSWYEGDDGNTYRIRLGDETLAVAGTAPAAGDNNAPFVKVTKSNRAFGLRPRMGIYGLDVTAGERTFTVYKRVPFLTPGALASAPQSITVDGDTYQLRTTQSEDR